MTLLDIRPEPERDRWGRYVLPDPDTGKKRGWTRATTLAKTPADTFGLTRWELRMAAVGLAKRPDLLAQVSTVTDPDNADAKKLLDGVCNEAKEAAGASVRRNLGTALHAMCEHVDAGRDFDVPAAHAADVAAYSAAITAAGLTIDPAHIERICVVPDLGVAGTFDRLATHDGDLVVADIKTGRSVEMGMGEIAIQLALYAHASHLWDHTTGEWEPMPRVDHTRALVLHLPAGEARCVIHEVDIAAGWEMAQVAHGVRTWRKRPDLSRTVTEKVSTTAGPNDRTSWVVDRLAAIKTDHPERVDSLRLVWSTDIARKSPWTEAEIDAISTVLHHHENA